MSKYVELGLQNISPRIIFFVQNAGHLELQYGERIRCMEVEPRNGDELTSWLPILEVVFVGGLLAPRLFNGDAGTPP